MICKACGTEGRGSFCSHCGAPLVNEAFNAQINTSASASATPADKTAGIQQSNYAPSAPYTAKQTSVVTRSNTALASTVAKESSSRRPKKRRRKACPKAQIKMRQVFFPSLVFFLPLIYLFVDAFTLYNTALYADMEGSSALAVLIARFADATFASNPISDVITATCGGDAVLWQTLTLRGVLGGGGAYGALVAPALILAVAAILSAVGGAAVLFTAGRSLRVRAIADTVILVGFFAAVAPFLSDLAFRLYHVANGGFEAADAAMRTFGLSVEVMLTFGLTLTLMLPAVRALRRAAAGEGVYLTAPYRVFVRKAGMARICAFLLGLVAALLPFATLAVKVSDSGTLLEVFFDSLERVSADLGVLAGMFGGTDAFTVLKSLCSLLLLPILPLMLLCFLVSFFNLVRLLLVSSKKVAASKRRRRAIKRTGKALRRAPVVLLTFYVVTALVAALFLFFATEMKTHLDFATVSDTLSLIYILMAYARSYVKLFSVGVMLAALSLVLSTVAGNFARAFVARCVEASSEE